MWIVKFLLAVCVCIFIYGCTLSAKTENMIYQGDIKKYDDNLKKNIGYISIYGGYRATPLGPPDIDRKDFYSAVKKSLYKQGLLSKNGVHQLEIFMVEVEQPGAGADMTVSMHVQYKITDANTKAIVFDEMISSSYTVTLEKAFAGATRVRMAIEGAGERNIQSFLEKLSTLELK